jgi:3alpha(or 20beta)-hydroxysteroid dehydrogenase
MELEGKIAVVTGAARGFGESIARAIVASGGRVLITDILDEAGEALACKLGNSARYHHLDVAVAADWQKALASALEHFGAPTILVNNAARHDMRRFDEISEEEFFEVWKTNELGCFLGMKAIVPFMRKAGTGSIINIGSIAAIHPAGGLAYTASKFAIRGLTRAAARDLGPDNIRVNTVLPSWIIGPNTRNIDPRFSAALPLRRMGDSDKLAMLVVFLASDAAEFITGSDYLADGGAMLMGTFDLIDLLSGNGIGGLSAQAITP